MLAHWLQIEQDYHTKPGLLSHPITPPIQTSKVTPRICEEYFLRRDHCTTAMASQGPTGAQPPEPKATTTPLFRPIEFEDNTGSEESECGESDSAYSSDNLLVPDVVQKSYNPKISTTLQNRNLWRHFCRNGNEMIVTKPGR